MLVQYHYLLPRTCLTLLRIVLRSDGSCLRPEQYQYFNICISFDYFGFFALFYFSAFLLFSFIDLILAYPPPRVGLQNFKLVKSIIAQHMSCSTHVLTKPPACKTSMCSLSNDPSAHRQLLSAPISSNQLSPVLTSSHHQLSLSLHHALHTGIGTILLSPFSAAQPSLLSPHPLSHPFVTLFLPLRCQCTLL